VIDIIRREVLIRTRAWHTYEPPARRAEEMVTMTLACPYCGTANTNGVSATGTWSVVCTGCKQQFLVRAGEVWLRPEDTPCGHGCQPIGPFGFVPEQGCPVHDKGAEESEHADT